MFGHIIVIEGSKTAFRMAGDDVPDLMVSFLLPSEGHRGRMHFSLSPNESERLAALHKLEILDTPSSPAIDRICRIAQRLFDVPMVHVTLADTHRYFFKARFGGSEATEIPRDYAFCNYTILHDEVFVVPDALADQTFSKNPHVMGHPFLRFYAGVPLTIRPGIRLGAFCISDVRPHEFSQYQTTLLRGLGRLVVDEIWLHHLEVSGQVETQFHASGSMDQSLDFETWILPTSAQIRAARGLLNWSIRELAEAASISPASVKRMEISGELSVRRTSVDAVVRAFEQHGVQFTREPDGTVGVARRSQLGDVRIPEETDYPF
ncbi:GAF domain-containing protein [Microvirga calopogonii]|uniref:GAF domain-containing protein n=1 Tax=Microvirga calopogonii TaxID=2078013 RepID=UPI0013B35BF5|nr:GAF domain-containing protein [Microvirga calopogonii]